MPSGADPAEVRLEKLDKHSVRGIIILVGFRPIRASLIGNVESKDGRARQKWLERMKAAGAAAE